MIERVSVGKAGRRCGVNTKTAFRWRHRLSDRWLAQAQNPGGRRLQRRDIHSGLVQGQATGLGYAGILASHRLAWRHTRLPLGRISGRRFVPLGVAVSSPLPKLRTLLYRQKAVLATPLDNKFIGEHNPPLSMLLGSAKHRSPSPSHPPRLALRSSA